MAPKQLDMAGYKKKNQEKTKIKKLGSHMKIKWKRSEEKKSSLIVRRRWNLLDLSFRRHLWGKRSCIGV